MCNTFAHMCAVSVMFAAPGKFRLSPIDVGKKKKYMEF